MTNHLRIATRRSPLALWQAEHVAERLEALHSGLRVELVKMVTRGDQILDAPLAKVGGKGLFVKELENALERGEADIAVHSMKDVPAALPEGFTLAAVLPRADARDALEFIIAGASAVQVGTANFVDPGIWTTLLDGITDYMTRHRIERIADLGEREGVTFVLENLNLEVDHPGVPFARAHDTLRLVSTVDSPNLKLNLDLYHAQIMEGDLSARIPTRGTHDEIDQLIANLDLLRPRIAELAAGDDLCAFQVPAFQVAQVEAEALHAGPRDFRFAASAAAGCASASRRARRAFLRRSHASLFSPTSRMSPSLAASLK